jgi:thioredoxin reductase
MNSVSSILGTSPPPASALTASEEPVLIVGAGLSAADAVLLCSALGIPVLHVFRRDGDDPNIALKKLPPKLYPEYHKVHQMMKDGGSGRNGDDGSGGNYQAYPQHCVKEFKEDGKVLLSHTKGKRGDIVVQVARAVILIGSRPDLSFLPDEGMNLGVVPGMHIDPKHNPIDVDPFTYQCVRAPGLFAMGPPAGDTFVRFLRGGALAITAHLWNKREGKL